MHQAELHAFAFSVIELAAYTFLVKCLPVIYESPQEFEPQYNKMCLLCQFFFLNGLCVLNLGVST
jgi:hypothetical protein